MADKNARLTVPDATAEPRPPRPPDGVGRAGGHDACAKLAAANRAEARRLQVLDAADECFRRHGFHCASMAEISKKAGMSAGHIYHYFANKEAIINTIVQMDLEIALTKMGEGEKDGGDLFESMTARVDRGVREHLDKDKASLRLEVLAEAGRNPKVATMVQEADEKIRQKLRSLLMSSRRGEAYRAEGDLDARVEVLLMLFNGLTARAITNPALDKDAIVGVVRRTIEHLLA